MKDKISIETKVEAALQSLERIERASVPNYFYNKVIARLERPKEQLIDKWNSLLLQPKFAFASLCLILILNAMVIFFHLTPPKNIDPSNNVAITEEYTQVASPSYYLENPKP